MNTALLEQRKAVQRALGVKDDGVNGPVTTGAWNTLWQPQQTASVVEGAVVVNDGDKVDARSETAIATLLPEVRPLARKLVRQAAEQGIIVKVTSGTRSNEEQNALYAQGRTAPGKIVTQARAGYSNHNFGLAFDLTIFENGQPVWESPKYRKLGAMGKEIGLKWGGDFTTIHDEPHFEYNPNGYSLAQLRERKSSGLPLV